MLVRKRTLPSGTEGKSVQFEFSWPLEEIFVPYGEEKQDSMVTDSQNRLSPKSWSFVETYGYKRVRT